MKMSKMMDYREYIKKNPVKINPEIWGPHYWFVLHTMAYTYPEYPTNVTKKKYYDFIQNIPLFLPDSQIGNKFAEFLDRYPITPFLDSRESFIRWVHFIHNKINVHLGKEEISIYKSLDQFRMAFLPRPIVDLSMQKSWRDAFYVGVILLLIFIVYYIA